MTRIFLPNMDIIILLGVIGQLDVSITWMINLREFYYQHHFCKINER